MSYVKCRDEADLCILSYARAIQHALLHAVVISNDSDFFFFPSHLEVGQVLSFRYFYNRERKLKAKRPWTITHLTALQSDGIDWPWQTNEDRWITALVAGQDYLPGGLPGVRTSIPSEVLLDSGLRKRERERACRRGQGWL